MRQLLLKRLSAACFFEVDSEIANDFKKKIDQFRCDYFKKHGDQ